jgi:hypothetical protein
VNPSFAWRYLSAADEEIGRSEPFADRAAAEEWLGSSWEDLSDRGAEAVELVKVVEGSMGVPVYRMPLGPS